MERTIEYGGIEKITYKFGTADILQALVDKFGIEVPRSAGTILDLYEEFSGQSQYAELVVIYKHDN